MDERKIAGSSGKTNPEIIRGFLPIEVRNSYWNHAAIVSMLHSGQALDLSEAPKVKGKPILVLSSGPSLDEALPLLKNWDGDILCTQSHAVTCVGWEKTPTYILAYDAKVCWDNLSPHPEGAFDEPALITHPGIGADVLPRWPSHVYLFQSTSPHIEYFDKEQSWGYSWPQNDNKMIGTRIRPFGSSVSAMVSIATMLGYRPIFLVGMDFGYPGGKKRFTKRVYEKGEWLDVSYGLADGDGEIEGCPTDRVQAIYKRALIAAWRIDKSPLINCSLRGTLGELMPLASVSEVIEKQGKGFKPYTWKQCILKADRYLAEQGHYVIESTDGSLFLTEQKSVKDLEKALADAKGRGEPIDIEKNMRRIRKAI